MMFKLAVIVGSLQQNSLNKKLAKSLMFLGKDLFRSTMIPLDEIPLFNQDQETMLPGAVTFLKKSVESSDGVIFVTPEYNRSIPGVLKNAIDWASRPLGQNSWGNKPASIVGISPSPVGTAVAQAHLRSVLSMLGMAVYCRPEVYLTATDDFFTAGGDFASESTKTFLRGYLEKYHGWINSYIKGKQ